MHKALLVSAALGLAAASILITPRIDAFQPVSGTGTFGILDRPQTADDRAARDSYLGKGGVPLTDARLLGEDPGTKHKFLLVKDRDNNCLVVIESAEMSVGGCELASSVGPSGLWVKYGVNGSAFVAIAVPDELSDAEVQAPRGLLLRRPNLAVVAADPLGAPTRVVLSSPRYRDVSIVTDR